MIEASHIKKSLWTKIKYKYWDIMKQIRELEELMDEKAEEMLKSFKIQTIHAELMLEKAKEEIKNATR